jgi:hypothetical protein
MHRTWSFRTAFVVLAATLAACGGGGGSASAPPSNPPPAAPQSQTLTFGSGSLFAYSGEVLTNKAAGQGTGAVTYGSDNSAVATVDSQGKITAVGVGKTNITASIAADAAYLAATASSSVEVFPNNIAMSAWIAPDGSDLRFAAEASTMSVYRSTDSNCDIVNYSLCASGQMNDIGSAPIADTSAKLSQAAFFTLKKGDRKTSQVVNATKFAPRKMH